MQTPTKATRSVARSASDAKSAHSVYNLNYHLVLVTKYRHEVLTGAVEDHIKDQMPVLCQRYGWEQLARGPQITLGEVMPNHGHLFVSAPPTTAPVTIAKTLKSILALSVFRAFPLRKKKHFWGSGLGSDGCYYGSAGTVSAATIAMHIENQENTRLQSSATSSDRNPPRPRNTSSFASPGVAVSSGTGHWSESKPSTKRVDGKVSLPKIGRVRAILHREMEGDIKSATVKQEADGHWNITFVSHLELPDAPAGMDTGLESFVTLHNGKKVKRPKFYRRGERKLRRAQRHLSRCKKNSRHRAKAKRRVALSHARVRHQRYDWLHQLSAQLVRLYDTICVEDLNLKGLVRTKLAKSFSDAAISMFIRMLEYKVMPRYGQVVKVGRFFPSTKTCSNPDCRHKQDLELCDRTWVCECCQTLHDRDINAVINILMEGLKILALGMRESLNADGGNVRLAKVSSCR